MKRILKTISSVSKRAFGTGRVTPFNDRIKDADEASALVYKWLTGDKPCMIARYGATELMTIINYLGVKQGCPNIFSYMLGRELDWWWRDTTGWQMQNWSGFFPPTTPNLERFSKMMLEDSKDLDVLISWLDDETRLSNLIADKPKIPGLFIDPFWAKEPWTRALAGKKVLVVHPFANLIQKQYVNKRDLLFKNKDVLPEFELVTIKAIQSLGGETYGFKTWFDALEHMENEIDSKDYDICLLGCGAYGFPLAAHIKRTGKKAVHVGGSLQLLFGIKGARWESMSYGEKELGAKGRYPSLMNTYWVKPEKSERSINSNQVENGCYW